MGDVYDHYLSMCSQRGCNPVADHYFYRVGIKWLPLMDISFEEIFMKAKGKTFFHLCRYSVPSHNSENCVSIPSDIAFRFRFNTNAPSRGCIFGRSFHDAHCHFPSGRKMTPHEFIYTEYLELCLQRDNWFQCGVNKPLQISCIQTKSDLWATHSISEYGPSVTKPSENASFF